MTGTPPLKHSNMMRDTITDLQAFERAVLLFLHLFLDDKDLRLELGSQQVKYIVVPIQT